MPGWGFCSAPPIAQQKRISTRICGSSCHHLLPALVGSYSVFGSGVASSRNEVTPNRGWFSPAGDWKKDILFILDQKKVIWENSAAFQISICEPASGQKLLEKCANTGIDRCIRNPIRVLHWALLPPLPRGECRFSVPLRCPFAAPICSAFQSYSISKPGKYTLFFSYKVFSILMPLYIKP